MQQYFVHGKNDLSPGWDEILKAVQDEGKHCESIRQYITKEQKTNQKIG